MMKNISKYTPLITLVIISFLAALAINQHLEGTLKQGMHYFMGFFLCCFSMFKIFDVQGFADGFQMYDLLAKRTRIYALLYPFIELALGLAYLNFFFPIFTYLATICVLTFGAVGVIKSLQEGLDLRCACMGTVLKVPLSTVTLTEDLTMSVLTLFMLFM